MFERFTDRARRVVVVAQEEAGKLGHNYIGTEHLLLGILGTNGGVAVSVLESLDISQSVIRQQVEESTGRGSHRPSGHIPFTPRAKKVLEFSLRESLDLGHNYIGTEHLLLGLIREGEGVAARVLTGLGADSTGPASRSPSRCGVCRAGRPQGTAASGRRACRAWPSDRGDQGPSRHDH